MCYWNELMVTLTLAGHQDIPGKKHAGEGKGNPQNCGDGTDHFNVSLTRMARKWLDEDQAAFSMASCR
jgi:hypothetical protein